MTTNPLNTNPLLGTIDELVDYAHVLPEHIGPAIDALLKIARESVDVACDAALPATWEAIAEPLDTASGRLWRAWSVAGHLNAVVNTPELREAYNDALPKVTEFSTEIGLNVALYAQYQRLADAPDFAIWSPVRRRIVDLALRDFRLSGVELEGEARERYAAMSEREASVTQKFSENVLDAIDAFSLFIADESRLDGLPDDAKSAAREAAAKDGVEGWKLTLKMPCYIPVMQYVKDRSLREALYRAYGTIASEQGEQKFDNSQLIEELLALRAEEAQLLGFESFAALRLQTRMASDTAEVTAFLRNLAVRAKPFAVRDVAELHAFAKTELGIDDPQPWDNAFISEHLRETRYAYSEDEVKQYFTEPRVLAGLYEVIETLFNVRLKKEEVSTWHEDATGLAVTNPEGQTLGYLYLDLYARSGKQGGAWVDSERSRRAIDGSVQTPVVYLTCNFSRPNGKKPAVWTHDDVITLFHETGHALHALLSEVDEPGAQAFASVEWDAIELPSQFMENFCWEWEVVQKLSSHVDTGMPLPRALYDRMVAARNFQSGMQAVRQIEFSLFDILLHGRSQGLDIGSVLELLAEVRREVAVLTPPAWHRFPHSFSHLFAGGYGAGYYSYKWAEVLSADAYEAFEDAAGALEAKANTGAVDAKAKANAGAVGAKAKGSTLDPVTGQRFRREILAVGGSRPAAESFQAFRGRPPRIDALLRHSGMAEEL
jgi:oligopeptidase A